MKQKMLFSVFIVGLGLHSSMKATGNFSGTLIVTE